MSNYSLEEKFHQLIFEGKTDEAQCVLDEYKELNPRDQTGMYCLQASLMRKRGDVDNAIELLTEAIDNGHNRYCRCHMSRVALYLRKGNHPAALNDCNIILEEDEPHIKQRFHNYYQFVKSYLLAVLKDPNFDVEISKIPKDYTVWISNRNLNVEDLAAIFRDAKRI
jgi:tetratricopeptide (TPR) repeat protein